MLPRKVTSLMVTMKTFVECWVAATWQIIQHVSKNSNIWDYSNMYEIYSIHNINKINQHNFSTRTMCSCDAWNVPLRPALESRVRRTGPRWSAEALVTRYRGYQNKKRSRRTKRFKVLRCGAPMWYQWVLWKWKYVKFHLTWENSHHIEVSVEQ